MGHARPGLQEIAEERGQMKRRGGWEEEEEEERRRGEARAKWAWNETKSAMGSK